MLRNIALFHEKGTRGVTTPISYELERDEPTLIAKFLSSISRDIPWHIFRLLPEYRMSDERPTNVNDLKAIQEMARGYLNHVFIGNLVGSEWLDTCCPQCKATLIRRINTGGCGSKLVSYELDASSCPYCGTEVSVVGECSLVFPGFQNSCSYPLGEAEDTEEEVLGLLDTQGQQKLFDFKSGKRWLVVRR